MSVDYSALLYDPVYAELGVPAVFSAGTATSEVNITVIDDTRARTTVSMASRSMLIEPVQTHDVGPGAFARIPELAGKGVTRDDYNGAVLTFNGRSWVVRTHELRGSPNGEDMGEVRFLLRAIVDD